MRPSHPKNLEDWGVGAAKPDLCTQRNAVNPQAGRIFAGAPWGIFSENLAGPLFDRVWERFVGKSASASTQNPLRNPLKHLAQIPENPPHLG